MARRLDDRLCTIERIMTAENPAWRQTCLPDSTDSLSDELLGLSSRSGGKL
jgi:phage shock protein B